MIVVVTHRRHVDPRAAFTHSCFEEALSYALSEGTCPPGCFGLTANLLYLGRCYVMQKPTADALVCWLRELTGSRFGALIELSFKPDPKETA